MTRGQVAAGRTRAAAAPCRASNPGLVSLPRRARPAPNRDRRVTVARGHSSARRRRAHRVGCCRQLGESRSEAPWPGDSDAAAAARGRFTEFESSQRGDASVAPAAAAATGAAAAFQWAGRSRSLALARA